ncbi:cysteine hydrolase family protein [Croceitalea sp. MTPC9]|uniref:cysteine hydrolase family protein n=1 Tax=unclassified Croceitalea TaxID=2632280 RepID=UPI002B3D8871|nr:cysteine hydrolase family protein [Croceitalea sp. MTPC6]GMN15342.1 cysteine hydrolase family protein [Croceitalea sp. MTPC9]
MNLANKKPALLLIDIQKGFQNEAYWGGNRNNKDAEKKCAFLLDKWRSLNFPVYHIMHGSQNPDSPLHPTKPGFALQDVVKPIEQEPVIVKDVNSAFIGTNLEKHLKDRGVSTLVIVGLTTNHCISTTTRMAGNLGFETILIADATATFDRKGITGEVFDAELIHQTTLASLNEEFAEVMKMEDLLQLLNS